MKYVLKSDDGKFLVINKGFTSEIKQASNVTGEEADGLLSCAKSIGINLTLMENKFSFGVVYIRKGDASGVVLKKKDPVAALGQVDPSRRRFATFLEAVSHGSRFHVRRAKSGDPEGTAGHVGFYVIETTDAVNAEVNPATGLTNSI